MNCRCIVSSHATMEFKSDLAHLFISLPSRKLPQTIVSSIKSRKMFIIVVLWYSSFVFLPWLFAMMHLSDHSIYIPKLPKFFCIESFDNLILSSSVHPYTTTEVNFTKLCFISFIRVSQLSPLFPDQQASANGEYHQLQAVQLDLWLWKYLGKNYTIYFLNLHSSMTFFMQASSSYHPHNPEHVLIHIHKHYNNSYISTQFQHMVCT